MRRLRQNVRRGGRSLVQLPANSNSTCALGQATRRCAEAAPKIDDFVRIGDVSSRELYFA